MVERSRDCAAVSRIVCCGGVVVVPVVFESARVCASNLRGGRFALLRAPKGGDEDDERGAVSEESVCVCGRERGGGLGGE